MLIRKKADIASSEITPESVYLQRRQFVGKAGLLALGGALTVSGCDASSDAPVAKAEASGGDDADQAMQQYAKLNASPVDKNGPFYTSEPLTPFTDVTRYNNFYEFGTDKSDPARLAGTLKTEPWSFTVEGEVGKPGVYQLEDILKGQALEERVYRLRCVEAWSMVVPWVGFPLSALLKRFEPTSKAKYVVFETLVDPEQMPGQRSRFSTIHWPYTEGLRMDEAMHPLTLMAVGLYGRVLPNQNGAPLRLVVPWKYGFKSIKSIAKIRLQEKRPVSSWQNIAPGEYGFYANVNPAVSHPRWSQASERRLPGSIFKSNVIPTLPFNGYGDQVAQLYTGMDLRKYY